LPEVTARTWTGTTSRPCWRYDHSMQIADPIYLRSWRAELALEYQLRGARTVLAARRHDGPLVVQKALYPEGDAVCHTIIVHPPAGLVGGDELDISCTAQPGSQVLLTTPGAGKWYRSAGPWAQQRIALEVQCGACVEWLPQESIVFDGAMANMALRVNMAGSAAYLGWEILCLGRTGSGERFGKGQCRLHTEIRRDGKTVWFERGRINPGGCVDRSPAGLGGHSVCGTLIATGSGIDSDLVTRCRTISASNGNGGITVPKETLLVARYLGDSSESARHYFEKLRGELRPAIAGRPAITPRIWNT